MKPGQRSLAPNTQDTEPKPGEYVVDKVVGVEMSDVGRRYKVRWLGYLGHDPWGKEVNLAACLAGARAAIEDFWIALEEPMPDSEVLRNHKRGRQMIANSTNQEKKKKKEKIVVDEKAATRHKSEIKKDIIFRG